MASGWPELESWFCQLLALGPWHLFWKASIPASSSGSWWYPSIRTLVCGMREIHAEMMGLPSPPRSLAYKHSSRCPIFWNKRACLTVSKLLTCAVSDIKEALFLQPTITLNCSSYPLLLGSHLASHEQWCPLAVPPPKHACCHWQGSLPSSKRPHLWTLRTSLLFVGLPLPFLPASLWYISPPSITLCAH